MVTVGLAVLAVIAVAFVVTRGRGFGQQRKSFDPSLLPRDPLTDVPTRSGLTLVLEDAVERAATADQQVGLMIVGLDGFRAVNDIWGHAAGDEVLRITAERLRAFASRPAGVARVAGDEFALIVEGEAPARMRQLADQIRAALCEPFEVEGSTIDARRQRSARRSTRSTRKARSSSSAPPTARCRRPRRWGATRSPSSTPR